MREEMNATLNEVSMDGTSTAAGFSRGYSDFLYKLKGALVKIRWAHRPSIYGCEEVAWQNYKNNKNNYIFSMRACRLELGR